MVHKLTNAFDSPLTLTQAVIQATQLLDLWQAELARILELQCSDIGELAAGRELLAIDSRAWDQACLFVDFYHLLYEQMNGDGVAMRHWLRADNKDLGTAPYLLLVDFKQLADVVSYLRNQSSSLS